MLALIAAVVLAAGSGIAHAHAAGDLDDLGRAAKSCHQTEFAKPAAGAAEGIVTTHADCMPLFDPLLHPASASSATYVVVAAPLPLSKAYRQHFASFDPPPPRSFS